MFHINNLFHLYCLLHCCTYILFNSNLYIITIIVSLNIIHCTLYNHHKIKLLFSSLITISCFKCLYTFFNFISPFVHVKTCRPQALANMPNSSLFSNPRFQFIKLVTTMHQLCLVMYPTAGLTMLVPFIYFPFQFLIFCRHLAAQDPTLPLSMFTLMHFNVLVSFPSR